MASPVIEALEQAMYTGSSTKRYYWAFRHPNPDAPPQTYRLTRKAGNGWALLLAASKATKEVLSFFAETEEDQKAVKEALRWLGIQAEVVSTPEGTSLRLPSGKVMPSFHPGGEKPKKKEA
jgi:hypothetical protein